MPKERNKVMKVCEHKGCTETAEWRQYIDPANSLFYNKKVYTFTCNDHLAEFLSTDRTNVVVYIAEDEDDS